jgi:hypothetical protein
MRFGLKSHFLSTKSHFQTPLLKLLPYSIELESRILKTYVICIKYTCKTCVL